MQIEEMITGNMGFIRALCIKNLTHSHNLDDLYGEVLEILWRYRGKFKGEGGLEGFKKWAATITRNTAITVHRRENGGKRQYFKNVDLEDGIRKLSTFNIESDYISKETIRLLSKAVRKRFSVDDQILFDLRNVGYSYDELVELTGFPLGTVKSKLHKIKNYLIGLGKEVF